MAQNGQNSLMFRKLSYYTAITGVITRTLDHRVISPSLTLQTSINLSYTEAVRNAGLLQKQQALFYFQLGVQRAVLFHSITQTSHCGDHI